MSSAAAWQTHLAVSIGIQILKLELASNAGQSGSALFAVQDAISIFVKLIIDPAHCRVVEGIVQILRTHRGHLARRRLGRRPTRCWT